MITIVMRGFSMEFRTLGLYTQDLSGKVFWRSLSLVADHLFLNITDYFHRNNGVIEDRLLSIINN